MITRIKVESDVIILSICIIHVYGHGLAAITPLVGAVAVTLLEQDFDVLYRFVLAQQITMPQLHAWFIVY